MMKKPEDIGYLRHSLAHLLAAAVRDLYPDALPTIGPAIDDGFYYDFAFSSPLKESDLPALEKKMKDILPSWKEFSGKQVSADEARELFKENPYKLELIEEIVSRGEAITLYTSGDFTDLCRGGHLKDMGDIDPEAFTLSRLAGAYWRGNEKNAMLTRIYGLAFRTKEELGAYRVQLEEATKRDHKKIGRELDLFTFSELVGPGLPLWTPDGTLVRNLLDDFVWDLRKTRGYQKVEIPHITKKDLYEKSGHWDKFQDELFRITTREGHEFAMKPMNCPHHTQIYARKQWSYRELPQRYANSTMCYRDEQTGELAGLSRLRSFTQDDAHVFCRLADAPQEMATIYDIVKAFYGAFGFALTPRISLHDPENMGAYLGESVTWQNAEEALRTLVKEKGDKAIEAVGEAAFYGPKIDFLAKDALGREWQVATIQLDMNMPERFNLFCINEKSEKERIVMIHAAIMGSIERFLSILIEHTGGVFPLWLSPVQVHVLPVNETHDSYAKEVHQSLLASGIRSEFISNGESLGKRIREAKVKKIPFTLVIGDKEIEGKTVTVESRDKGNIGVMNSEKFCAKISEEIQTKK